MKLKAKEIYGHITQGQENVKPSQLGLLAHTFPTAVRCENIKLAGEAGAIDQEATEDFKKYLLSVAQERGYVRVLS